MTEPPAKRARVDDDDDGDALAAQLAAAAAPAPAPGGGAKSKKKPYCLTFGYIGTGFLGSQYNAGVRTVEEVLLRAVHAAGGISDANMQEGDSGMSTLQRIGWMRSSRTDKGVHARVNAVSMRMLEPDGDGGNEGFVRAINAALPGDGSVRLYAVHRVLGSFHAKYAVDARTYAYVLPTYALCENFLEYFDAEAAPLHIDFPAKPGKDDDDEGEGGDDEDDGQDAGQQDGKGKKGRKGKGKGKGKGGKGKGGKAGKEDKKPRDAPPPRPQRLAAFDTVPDAIWDKMKQYRLTDSARERAARVLGQFLGTQTYHNFTNKKAPSDPSVKRYITHFGITDVSVQDGLEVATITVRGASFMIYQIRRMIGAALGVILGRLPETKISDLLKPETIQPVPTAPPDGLLLHALHFDHYNQKLERLLESESNTAPGTRPLDLKAEEPDMVAMEPRIRQEVLARETEHRVMAAWMRSLPHCLHRYWGVDVYSQAAADVPQTDGPVKQ